MSEKTIPWTLFWDMHSGGGTKEDPFDKIYIQAPEAEARVIFYNRFGHSPDRVTCTCCGEDYSLSEEPTLEQASAYHRGATWDSAAQEYVAGTGRPVEDYAADERVLVVTDEEVKPEERGGSVPAQGYVWVD